MGSSDFVLNMETNEGNNETLVASAEVGSENDVKVVESDVKTDVGGRVVRAFDDKGLKLGGEKIGTDNDSEAIGLKEDGDGSVKRGGGEEDIKDKGLKRNVFKTRSSKKEAQETDDMERNGEENGGEESENDEDDVDIGDPSCEYRVGDFVWGKIKSYPWWPGQIYDASDASDYALKLKQKNRFLVAYFGDGSFSWCSPSQLKPFVENYKVMSEQSNSKNFVYAIEAALDEVSTIVELEMTCSCLGEDGKPKAGMACNSGIKEGVLVPVEGVGKSFIAQCEPEKLIDSLRDFAETVSLTNMLELTVLKSWLTAYYRAKGGYSLPSYYYPRTIEGLEDKSGNPVEVLVQGPDGEEWLPAPVIAVGSGLTPVNQSLLQKCQETSADILYQRRKQKSVAELIEDEMKKENFLSESISNEVTTGKRKREDDDEAERHDTRSALQSGPKRGRRPKAVTPRSPRTGESNDSSDGPPTSGRLQNKIVSGGESEAEEEGTKSNRLRERKSRRISEILVRNKWRNPILVGISAHEVSKNFIETLHRRGSGGAFPVELCGLSVISIENDLENCNVEIVKSRCSEVGKMVEQSNGSGVLVNLGNLKALVGEAGVCADGSVFVVRELSRLMEIHTSRLWLIGVASEYDMYLKFVKEFPSIEKDWDLQVLPITSSKSSMEESYSRSSLTESFVPLGGFFSTPSEVTIPLRESTHCASRSRCHLCNEKCEQEVASLTNGGYTASVAYQFPSNLPSWLDKHEHKTTRASDVKANDSMVLSAQVVQLQKKWDNICQRLHYAPFLAKPDTYRVCSQIPTVMGFQVVQDGNKNASNHSNSNTFSAVRGCKLAESSRLISRELNATAEASTKVSVVPESINARLQETAESNEHCGLKSPLESYSSSNIGESLTSPTCVTSVTTDSRLKTDMVIEKSSSQSRQDLMQDFCGCFPVNSGMLDASTKNNASNSSSCPSSYICGQFDQKDYKYLYTSLFSKIGRQEEAMGVISRTIARCKSGNGKRQGVSRRDIWFNFFGYDGICKKKTAAALAEILYGGSESFICVNLAFKDGMNYTSCVVGRQEQNNSDMEFRGKTIVDYIADELRKKPLSVVYLENIDRSDAQVQNSLSYALKNGRLLDSHGREVSTGNAVFVTTLQGLEGSKIASSTKENFNYSEENVLATKGRPVQILIGFDLGDNVISAKSSVLSSARKYDSTPVFLNKRKLVVNDGTIRQHKASEVVKRPHTASKIPVDLNLPAEESEMTDVENFDNELLSENSKAWLEEFLANGDETVTFKPFDFDALAVEMLTAITRCFHNIIGSEGSLEIDSQVMEQILAAVYLSDSSKVDDWIKQVLGQAFVEVQKRYNLTARSVVKVVSCKVEEQGQGVFLPDKIIMNY